MSSNVPTIVTGAYLGQIFDLSERSIREHRAKGHIVRLGNGYDFKRSVRGIFDHIRVEGAKKGLGEPGEPLWQSYEEVLRYRAAVCDQRDRLRDGLAAILALPNLPEKVQAAVRDLLGTSGPEEEGGDG